MNLKAKTLGLLAAGLLALGVASPALADDTHDVTYTINEGPTFSVEFTGGTNFSPIIYTLGDASPGFSAAMYYTVTDLRGTGDGWTVNASTAGFTSVNTDAEVPGETLRATNLEYPWVDGVLSTSTNSILTGVNAHANWSSLMGGGATVASATAGLDGVFPNGTGAFNIGDALYLQFPFGVAADTYTATIQLTLTSNTI
jgi:hypothetical protein